LDLVGPGGREGKGSGAFIPGVREDRGERIESPTLSMQKGLIGQVILGKIFEDKTGGGGIKTMFIVLC